MLDKTDSKKMADDTGRELQAARQPGGMPVHEEGQAAAEADSAAVMDVSDLMVDAPYFTTRDLRDYMLTIGVDLAKVEAGRNPVTRQDILTGIDLAAFASTVALDARSAKRICEKIAFEEKRDNIFIICELDHMRAVANGAE